MPVCLAGVAVARAGVMKDRRLRRADLLKGLLVASVPLALGVAFAARASDEKTVKAPKSIVGEAINTLASEAASRREERDQSDPQYARRIDAALNEGRVNILLYGYGETHEPPLTERAFIGSITIGAVGVGEQKAGPITLTHHTPRPAVLGGRGERGVLALAFEPEGILLHNLGNVAGIAKSLVTRAEEPLPEIT